MELPRSLFVTALPALLGTILQSYEKATVGAGDVLRWCRKVVGVAPEMEEVVKAMVLPTSMTLGRLLSDAFTDLNRPIQFDPPCWGQNRDADHRATYRIRTVGGGVSADDAIAALRSASSTIAVAHRQLNNPFHPNRFAVLAWQESGKDDRFMIDLVNRPTADEERVVGALLACDIVVDDLQPFKKAVNERFGDHHVTRSGPKAGGARERSFHFAASQQRRRSCNATRRRFIFESGDADDCFFFHLGWELDIMSKFQPKEPGTARAHRNRVAFSRSK